MVRVEGKLYSYKKFVAAKSREHAEEKARRRFRFSDVRVEEEMGDIIV
jgi:hypothetical protein